MATSSRGDDETTPPEPQKQDIQFLDGFILVNMSSNITSIDPMGVLSTCLEKLDLALSQPVIEFGYFMEKCSQHFRRVLGLPMNLPVGNMEADQRPYISRPHRNEVEPSQSLEKEAKFKASWGSAKIIFPRGSAIDGSDEFTYRLVCTKTKKGFWQCIHLACTEYTTDREFFEMCRLVRQESSLSTSLRRIVLGESVSIKHGKFTVDFVRNSIDKTQVNEIPSLDNDEWTQTQTRFLPSLSENMLQHLYHYPNHGSGSFGIVLKSIAKRRDLLTRSAPEDFVGAYGLLLEDVGSSAKRMRLITLLTLLYLPLSFFMTIFGTGYYPPTNQEDFPTIQVYSWLFALTAVSLNCGVFVVWFSWRKRWDLFRYLIPGKLRPVISEGRHSRPLGSKQTKWTNIHGTIIEDNHFELIPGTLQGLEDHLPRYTAASTDIQLGRFVNRTLRSIGTKFNWLSKNASRIISLPVHNKSSQSDVETIQLTEPTVPYGPTDSRNVLLCISSLRPSHHKTTMRLVNIISVANDEELFLALKSDYRKFIGRMRWWFSMRTVIKLRFVHFEVNPQQLVDIKHYSREDKEEISALPPDSHDDYLYDPKPVGAVPPIGHNTLLEFWHTPQNGTSTQVCMLRLPTYRLDAVPRRYHDKLGEAWGIEVIEGRRWEIFWYIAALVFVGSATFGVAWGVVHRSLSDSFGVASFLQTSFAVTVALATLSATVDYTS